MAARAEFLEALRPTTRCISPPQQAIPQGAAELRFAPTWTPGFGNQFREETWAAFMQLNFSGSVLDRTFNFRMGYRYEETDVTSSAESQSFSSIVWASTNEFTAIPATGTTPSGLTGTYDVACPISIRYRDHG